MQENAIKVVVEVDQEENSPTSEKSNLDHNVPFLKHGGPINQCMLWNLRVTDYADTEELDIGQELRTGQVPDDQQRLAQHVDKLQSSIMPIMDEGDALKLTTTQKARLDAMRLKMNAMTSRVERIAMKTRIKTRKTRFLARNLMQIQAHNNTAKLANKALEKRSKRRLRVYWNYRRNEPKSRCLCSQGCPPICRHMSDSTSFGRRISGCRTIRML